MTHGHVQILNNFILIHTHTQTKLGFPGGSVIKNPPAMQVMQEMQVQTLGWENPLEEAWQPTPVFLPGESHGQRSLVGSSPYGHKELDTTEVTEPASMHALINHLRILLNFRS